MNIEEDGVDAVREREIARYVDEVRQALADLPPQVRDELLEDLPEHLAEVAAETDGPLADRIGPPQAYAAELRGAAGLRPPANGRNLDQRIAAVVAAARGRLRAVDTKAGPVIGYARASDYLRLLRPVWWVVRGYLVAMLIAVVLNGSASGLLPRIGGSTLAAVLLLAATVLGSIWLGRRSDRFGPRTRLALHGSALVLVAFALYAFVEVDTSTRDSYRYAPIYHDPYSHIQDVYVYDSEGRLIEGARLFDQNGQPIRLGYPWCSDDQQVSDSPHWQDPFDDPMRRPYPYCPHAAPFRVRPSAAAPAPPPSPADSTLPAPTAPAPGAPAPTAPALDAPAPDASAPGTPAPGAPIPTPSPRPSAKEATPASTLTG